MIGDAGKEAEAEGAELEGEYGDEYSEADEPPEAGTEEEGLHNGEGGGEADYDRHRDLDGGVMAAEDCRPAEQVEPDEHHDHEPEQGDGEHGPFRGAALAAA